MEVVVDYCDCEVENSSLALLMDDVHDIAAAVEEEHTFVNVNDKKIVVVAVVDG